MDVKKETVFSLAGENPVMEGCTISSLLSKEKTISSSAFRWQRIRASAGKSMPPPACTMFSGDV